jgi:predicted transcriptional regulator
MDKPSQTELLKFTSDIVSAHVTNNSVPTSDLTKLIEDVYVSLSGVGSGALEILKPPPAVSPKKSVFPDYIICLEDGKKLKMLKRHLKTSYNLSPDEYRQRWDLASDYPMVSPNYAKHRSSLAKKIGLGTKHKNIKNE